MPTIVPDGPVIVDAVPRPKFVLAVLADAVNSDKLFAVSRYAAPDT